MNAGRITSSEDFRHLARKLTHTCLEKERRHTAFGAGDGAGESLTMTNEIRKKIDKLVDSFFDKLNGVYTHAS